MERESVEEQESRGVTHGQRTHKISLWHWMTLQRSQMTSHC